MILKLVISLFLIVMISVLTASAFADTRMSLDKASYVYGETIKVSGKVQYGDGMVVIQIRSPSDIVAIDQFLPSSSGSFLKTFEISGSKWQEAGTYKIIVSYNGEKTERTFQFSKPQPKVEQADTVQKQEIKQEVKEAAPKVAIKGFPDITVPPKYYYDKYDNDMEFKRWFDSVFPGYSVRDVVGYKSTGVAGYPDPEFSPQYYIDRYNNESLYRDWFDSHFPDMTIYDVVGVPEQLKTLVPSWVKQYTALWSSGNIDDDQFIRGITDLIDQNIISIDDDIVKTDNKDKSIPSWFKSTARWYSEGLITEKEFLFGLQYLIEKEVIVV